MITVLVVDPVRIVREGIRTLIEKEADMKVVATAENNEQAIQLAQTHKPDVVLLEIPNKEAVQTCTKIREVHPHARVIYLTENKDIELIFRGIANGVDGFLVKDLYPDMLCQAIRDAARGQHVIAGDVAKLLVDQVRKFTMDVSLIIGKKLENKGFHITKRELDILALLTQGHSNHQIAKELHLSEGTIKNYISEIYMKLGVNQRDKVIKFIEDLLGI
ncbi:response regulator [Ornithinibacillus californiensis]|uniref:response regulator n=1 Tax=Ornithinibacillus californiensis TaxID=161536 RepID=UPI00064D7D52|nr:response regulator transcription factor [Ornithinibacillus californiensis]